MVARQGRLALATVLALVAVLFIFSPVASALSQSELDGVTDLFSAFPSLQAIPAAETFSDEGVFLGASWIYNQLSTTCEGGDGWAYHGIHCASGVIDEIYLYVPSNLASKPFYLLN